MKQVLLIDAPLLFREYLKEKLSTEKVSVEIAQGRRDAFTKMISTLPSLIIIDISSSLRDIVDFLEKKRQDPNAAHIPIIVTGPIMSREQVALLQPYNVVKYFNKPINFDIFFESVGRLLKISISLDTSPCILETHINNNIIFVEIARGLNREKLSLLKYKLTEIIDANKLTIPKLVIMLTDLSLSFIDGSNLEILFDSVIADSRIQKRNIKVLSLDNYTRDFIEGHIRYNGIEVVSNLSDVLNSLVENNSQTNVNELITSKILTQEKDTMEGTVQMRFYAESNNTTSVQETPDISNSYKIALLDDDFYTRNITKQSFAAIRGNVDFFDSGAEFLATTKIKKYDLIIMDMFMPGLSGFDILTNLLANKYPAPIIIYSTVMNKDIILQAMNLGAKAFLIKPVRPDILLQKANELIAFKPR